MRRGLPFQIFKSVKFWCWQNHHPSPKTRTRLATSRHLWSFWNFDMSYLYCTWRGWLTQNYSMLTIVLTGVILQWNSPPQGHWTQIVQLLLKKWRAVITICVGWYIDINNKCGAWVQYSKLNTVPTPILLPPYNLTTAEYMSIDVASCITSSVEHGYG
jgi:hypothetical protein